MAIVCPEDCSNCRKESCICRECQGQQASHCFDLDGNRCDFQGSKTCLWFEDFGTHECLKLGCDKTAKYIGSRNFLHLYRCECGFEFYCDSRSCVHAIRGDIPTLTVH